MDQRLVDRKLALIRLFTPAFDHSPVSPGYVKGYVPGVRENGAQYTHAAVWAVMAFAAAGDVKRAWELFSLINPVNHGDSAQAIARYRVEPYVAAADVYTNPQHSGRGGWSWYTGSAAWMYRAAIESLLGLRLEVDRLYLAPLLPAGWGSFDVHYRYRSTLYHLHVRGPVGGGSGVERVNCYGNDQDEHCILLRDDGGEYHAEIWIGTGS
jgi:cyclic beta-1,2-glucan synthetase